MSDQRAKLRVISAYVGGSAASNAVSVSSEKTTPKPNVSSGALRSQTVTSFAGSSRLKRIAAYSPPGPPPVTATFIASRRRGRRTAPGR